MNWNSMVVGYAICNIESGLMGLSDRTNCRAWQYREELTRFLMVLMCSTATISLAGMSLSFRQSWTGVKMTQRPLTRLPFAAPGWLIGELDYIQWMSIIVLFVRGKGKVDGVQTDDDEIRSDLETIQPPLIDTKATISPEDVTNISSLPRGTCTGTLIPGDNSTTPATTSSPATTTDQATSGESIWKYFVNLLRYFFFIFNKWDENEIWLDLEKC